MNPTPNWKEELLENSPYLPSEEKVDEILEQVRLSTLQEALDARVEEMWFSGGDMFVLGAKFGWSEAVEKSRQAIEALQQKKV